MLERGFSVRLLTDTGSSVPGEGAGGFAGATQDSADSAGLMMDTLAVVDHSDGGGLSRAYDVLRGGNEGLLVGLLRRSRRGAGRGRGADAAAQRGRGRLRARQRAAGRTAPAGHGPVEERLRLLREAGWTALAVRPGAALPELWRLARASERTNAGAARAARPARQGDGHERARTAGAVRLRGHAAGGVLDCCRWSSPARLARPGRAPAGGPERGRRAGPAGAAGPAADRARPGRGGRC